MTTPPTEPSAGPSPEPSPESRPTPAQPSQPWAGPMPEPPVVPHPLPGPPATGAPVPYYPPPYPVRYVDGPMHALPPQYQGDPGAPFGREPFTGIPLSDKSKIVAGLLQITLGMLGIGRFYTGHTSIAVLMLSLTVVGVLGTFVVVGIFVLIGVQIWAFVDGIVLLAGRQTDARGLLLRT